MDVINSDYELVPIDQLVEHPENPRDGDEESIAESEQQNGIYGAALVQRSTNHIIVGNHRVKVAKEEGATEFPVIWADVDDDQALAILLADNKTSDASRGNNAPEVLVDVLDAIAEDADSVLGTGYDEGDVEELRAAISPPPPPESHAETEQPSEDGLAVTVRVGELHFATNKQAFDEWSLAIRKQCGFDNRRVKLEILNRLGVRVTQ